MLKILTLLLLLTSCGYKLDPLFEEVPTITVPYVVGDIEGELTAAIVKEISSTGRYAYRSSGGDFILLVRIIDEYTENIGFRYDRHRTGKLKKEIIPVEGRSIILAEVELVSSACSETVKGPIRLQASVDYDHDYYTIRNKDNVFSLGQVSDVDAAEEAAETPLYQKLAEKIADYLIYSW